MAVVKDSKQEGGGIQRWFQETRGELRKVVWPSREEALRLTYVLGLLDFLLNSLYTFLIS
jgi:preprotein translocase subunit SecE